MAGDQPHAPDVESLLGEWLSDAYAEDPTFASAAG